MNIEIKGLQKKDFNLARKFAIEGMGFSHYLENKLLLYLYSKYIWYLELLRATKTYCAYIGDKLVGFLLVDIKNKPKIYKSYMYKLYIKITEWVMNKFYKDSNGTYNNVNKEMMDEFVKNKKPDGEIVFFAVDPEIKGKGIGTLLFNELSKDESGKIIYAYTDSNCNFQFYQKWGFIESGKKEIKMDLGNKNISLTCFLFSKVLENSGKK